MKSSVRILVLGALLLSPTAGDSQDRPTIRRPVGISLEPADPVVRPGQRSALLLVLRIPRGFRIGDASSEVRMPAPTLVEPAGHRCFAFGEVRFPDPLVQGVPVRLGTARVFEGKVRALVPFDVDSRCGSGPQTITVFLTYTPAVSAGQLSTHVREPYQAQVTVAPAPDDRPALRPPSPRLETIADDFVVVGPASPPPGPLSMTTRRFAEDGPLPRLLHRVFVDPPNHGKHLQLMPHPYYANGRHRGRSVGAGVSLLNTTREGIMTGTVDLLAYDNEYVGSTAALNAVSCPAAYHNYWFTAEVSAEDNRQLHFHTEDLTLGRDSRFGYELQLDLFRDPRNRFYGLGGRTDESDETAYTHEQASGTVDLYWNAATHFRFTAGARARRVTLSRPTDSLLDQLPYTRSSYGDLPGMRGATIVGERLSVIYDGRNQEFKPTAGTYGRVLVELDHGVSDAEPAPRGSYGRLTVELRSYRSTADQRLTLLLRNRWQFTSADDGIPFYELPSLGGQASLRGFDRGRFYGRHSVFGSGELRVHAMHLVMMGFPMDLEMAPFIDAGQVFQDEDFEGQFNVNPGLSLRALNPPNVGIVLNGAVGQDGLIFTGGVSLPF